MFSSFARSQKEKLKSYAFAKKAVLVGALMGNIYACNGRTGLGIPEYSVPEAGAAIDAGVNEASVDSGIRDAGVQQPDAATCAQDAGSPNLLVNANFQAGISPIHFNTDIQFNNTFSISLVSGNVVHGNPVDLQDGDTVCSGAVVKVTASVDAKWAVSMLDVLSMYPVCGGGSYCPQMIDYSVYTYNQPVAWIDSIRFNDNKNFGDVNDLSQNQVRYTNLGPSSFSTEPMAYLNASLPKPNKEGGAAIFCSGAVEVLQNGTISTAFQLPTIGSTNLVMGAGTQRISTQLSGTACFASVVKHPIDLPSHPEYFFLFYFTHNAPNLACPFGQHNVNINVQNTPCP